MSKVANQNITKEKFIRDALFVYFLYWVLGVVAVGIKFEDQRSSWANLGLDVCRSIVLFC